MQIIYAEWKSTCNVTLLWSSAPLFSRNVVLSKRDIKGDLIYISNRTVFGLDTKDSEIISMKNIDRFQDSQWNLKKIDGDSSSRTHVIHGILFFIPLHL